jgi:hypothetical protein
VSGEGGVVPVGCAEGAMVVDLVGCARCRGEGHTQLEFAPLTHPMSSDGIDYDFTHWAPCPTNGEPILLRVVPTGVPARRSS